MSESWIDKAVRIVGEELPGGPGFWLENPEVVPLTRLSALLALTTGEGTSTREAYQAWAMWASTLSPDSEAPTSGEPVEEWDEMTKERQANSVPFRDGIRRAAKRLKK